MKKIILAFDSFKGSVSSVEISDAATDAILSVFPECEVVSVPVADGGEGTTEAICSAMDVVQVKCKVHDPLMNVIEGKYAITSDGSTAIMEMATASGLPLVAPELRNPLNTTTFGTGEMIADAVNRGCHKIILGIGGSATNDGAIGLLSALGVVFKGIEGNRLNPIGRSLNYIADFDDSALEHYRNIEFIVACDVNNPLYGENGAAYVYAPQKGASPENVVELDSGLRNYAKIINAKRGKKIDNIPGSGAAGGMGGGLLAFLDAKLMPGIETILIMLNFSELLKGADLVLTGEGKIDAQTGMGKALGGILKMSQKENVPVIAIAGAVDDAFALNNEGFTAVFSIQSAPVSLEKAMDKSVALSNIRNTIKQIARTIKQFKN